MQRKDAPRGNGTVREVAPPAPVVAKPPVPGGVDLKRSNALVDVARPLIEKNEGEAEHREFPRAQLATRFEVWVDGEGGSKRFAATFTSVNVSISGAFLHSTFWLPMGTVLGVRFSLEPGALPVQARAEIVREARGDGPGGRSGFGIRFLDFSGQTEVSLARLFVGMRLRAFAEEYLKSQRARGLPNELERVVDVLAAWELLKATTSAADPWGGK